MSVLFPTYKRWELEPAYAKGARMTGENGKEYLDFTSGIGVCNLGHCHEAVKEQVEAQLDKFWHVSNFFPQNIQEQAGKLLAEASGMDYVFFANSGAEANEAAIKLARKATGRSKIISFKSSFHGRTLGAMAATGQEKVWQGFGSMPENFVHLPFNDCERLWEEDGTDTAAVMLEVIQGEGGIHPASEKFLKETEAFCRKNDALFMVDEIQTGIGRTGKAFAFQHYGVQPDIITAAKGLGSGFPIGAMAGKGWLGEAFGPGSHGSTFGGNAIATTAAKATMEIIFNENFLRETRELGVYLAQLLKQSLGILENVRDIRGIGLMVGIEITEELSGTLQELRENGLLALPAGENVIRLLPPLNVNKMEIDEAVSLLEMTLKKRA